MKPRRTWFSEKVLRLEGGTEDNDLWYRIQPDATGGPHDGHPVVVTVWEPSEEERKRIAGGENVMLMVWGLKGPSGEITQPPVAVSTTDEPLGRMPIDER